NQDSIELINREFAKVKAAKRIHGPFLALAPASSDTRIRNLSKQRMLSGLRVCKALGCDNIVLHSHYDPVYHKKHKADWQKYADMTWADVEALSKELCITVNIENSEDDGPDAVFYLLDRYPSFKACFDLAHYTVFGLEPWKDILASYPNGSVNEAHISDNNTKEDQHLILGRGLVDIKGFLRQLRLAGNAVVTIEPHSKADMIKDIEYMRDFS
ncbi:MAG: sugar phosphate isomerase/epimerase, partial [Candidatus Omnitrophica bacterium]|nr:sugar phosphate isomerase/epimerase [Candidatus Omnitrophota bacterium]